MVKGWFRAQLRAWGRRTPPQVRIGWISLAGCALGGIIAVGAWGLVRERHVGDAIDLGLWVALAALASVLLMVPLMAWGLMRLWPIVPTEVEAHDGVHDMAEDEPMVAGLMGEEALPLSDTLFDLDLVMDGHAHPHGHGGGGHAQPSTIEEAWAAMPLAGHTEEHWQRALRSARHSHALGAKIGEHLARVAQARQRIAEALAVIDTIALETNALALQAVLDVESNLALRGAAVESVEVRTLAQRAASAAREIHGVVQATEVKMDPVVLQVVADIHVEALVADAQAMLACLDELHEPLPVAGARPAVQGGGPADHPVNRMDSVIARQNTWAHHSACLAHSLNAQADRLHKVVGAFRILQQTQAAAWLTHRAIHQARDMARDSAREGRNASRPAL